MNESVIHNVNDAITRDIEERCKDESFRKQLYTDPVLYDFYCMAKSDRLDASTIVAMMSALSAQKLAFQEKADQWAIKSGKPLFYRAHRA